MLSQIILVGAASLAASFVVARLNASSMKVGDNTYSLKKYSYIVLAVAIALAIFDICLIVLPSNATTVVKLVIAVLMIMIYMFAIAISRCQLSLLDDEIKIKGLWKKQIIKYADIKRCVYMDNGSINLFTYEGKYSISDIYPTADVIKFLEEKHVAIGTQSDDNSFDMYMDRTVKIVLIVFNIIAMGFLIFLSIYGYNDGQDITLMIIFTIAIGILGIIVCFSYLNWNIHVGDGHITYVCGLIKKDIDIADIKYAKREIDSRDQKVLRIYNYDNKKILEVFDSLNNSTKFPAYLKRHGVKIEK